MSYFVEQKEVFEIWNRIQECINYIGALNIDIEYGIITPIEASEERDRTMKKEYVLKEMLVSKVHLNLKNGEPRAIINHGPTKDYPKGYWYTRINANYKPKRATKEELLDVLIEHYGLSVSGTTVDNIHKSMMEEERITKNLTDKTFSEHEYDYLRYLDEDFRNKEIKGVDVVYLCKYSKDFVTKKQRTIKDFNSYKSVLNRLFDYSMRHHFVDSNPLSLFNDAEYRRSCSSGKKTADEKVLSKEEIERIKAEIERRSTLKIYHGIDTYGYMTLLSIETGMRAGEICSIKWNDISTDIWIHSQIVRKTLRSKESMRVPWTKNEKKHEGIGRHFPLTDRIVSILTELKEKYIELGYPCEDDDYVFCRKDGSFIIPSDYEDALRRLCKKIGLPKTNNHALRMAFNSYVLIPLGIPVTDRAKLLGHSVETNLKHYSFEDKDYCEKALKALNSLNPNPQEPQ